MGRKLMDLETIPVGNMHSQGCSTSSNQRLYRIRQDRHGMVQKLVPLPPAEQMSAVFEVDPGVPNKSPIDLAQFRDLPIRTMELDNEGSIRQRQLHCLSVVPVGARSSALQRAYRVSIRPPPSHSNRWGCPSVSGTARRRGRVAGGLSNSAEPPLSLPARPHPPPVTDGTMSAHGSPLTLRSGLRVTRPAWLPRLTPPRSFGTASL